MIVFVGGLIGAGKSTVAKALAAHFSLHYYDVDEVKRHVFKQDPDYDLNMQSGTPFSDETRTQVYSEVVEDLKALSAKHSCIVVDDSLHKRALRRLLFDAAEEFFGGYFVIWVQADEDVIIHRLTSQTRKNHILKDPMAMHNSILAEFESFEQCVFLCRNNSTIEETMQKVERLFDSIFRFSTLKNSN
jgi:gluconate kinase